MKNQNSAFTLIELLVVVLMIGILAVIAVPQYETAVWKTRFSNYKSVATNYRHAIEVYQAETGAWPPDLSVLAVNLPGETKTPTGADCVSNAKMYCCLDQEITHYQQATIICGRADYKMAYQWVYRGETSYCIGKKDTAAARACQSMAPTVHGQGTNCPTPTGHKTGYVFYKLKN